MAIKPLTIKNNSGSSQMINDLGLLIVNGGQETLSSLMDVRQALCSGDLLALAEAGTLILNNGKRDILVGEVPDFMTRFDTGFDPDLLVITTEGGLVYSNEGEIVVQAGD